MKLLAWVAICALLLWQIVTRTLVAYLAEADPRLALRLDAGDPVALMTLAEGIVVDAERKRASSPGLSVQFPDVPSRLAAFAASAAPKKAAADPAPSVPDTATVDVAGAQPQDLAAARDLVERALAREPMSERGFTLLGRIAELSVPGPSGLEAAAPYYERASRLSRHATEATYGLLRHNLAQKRYDAVLEQADTLLRTSSRAAEAVLPVLARLAEMPTVQEHVKKLLATDPPWRRAFLGRLPQLVTDARTPMTLLLGMKDAGRPPVREELAPYLSFLVARNFHELAYYAWLQFLSSDQLAAAGLLFNGGFDAEPSGYPFDWVLGKGPGANVDFLPLPDEPGRALRVEFTEGRVQFGGVTQLGLLAPGNYILTGHQKGELQGRRGLRWRVHCLPAGGRPIGEGEMQLGPIPTWRQFSIEFKVPATGCAMQRIRLELDARSASETLVRGTFWYDKMEIRRSAEEAQ